MKEILDIVKNIVNTAYLFVFFISLVNILRHLTVYYFQVIKSEFPVEFKMSSSERKYLLFSIGMVLTAIFTLFKLI